MNFVKTTYISAITNIISIGTKLVVNKLIAFLGPSSFAIFGQFKDLITIATTISQFGTENGIVKYTADLKDNKPELNHFLGTVFTIHLLASGITTLLVILFQNLINKLLFETNDYSILITVTISSLIFASLYNLTLNFLNGIKDLRSFTIITIISTITSALITILLVLQLKLNGLIISLAVNNVVLLLIGITYIKIKTNLNLWHFKLNLDKRNLNKLLQFSIMSLVGILVSTFSLLLVRTHIINNSGEFDAGIWDSTWRLSALYFTFLTASLKFYLVPTFTSIPEQQLKNEVLKIWKIISPLVIVITLSIFLLKNHIIKILFTEEFLAINAIIIYQLIGDIFRIHTWTLGNIVIAKSKTKFFVISQIFWGICFCSLSFLFFQNMGIKGITLSYAITCLLHFIIINIYLKNLVWQIKTY